MAKKKKVESIEEKEDFGLLLDNKMLSMENEQLKAERESIKGDLKHNRTISYMLAGIAIAFLLVSAFTLWKSYETTTSYEQTISSMQAVHTSQLREAERASDLKDAEIIRLRETIEIREATIRDKEKIITNLQARPDFIIKKVSVNPNVIFTSTNTDSKMSFTITLETSDNKTYPIKVWLDKDYKYTTFSDRYDIYTGWVDIIGPWLEI